MPDDGNQPEVWPRDPLLSGFPLPLEGIYFPMGFPVRIATNSEAVLHAAEEAWGLFEKRFDFPPVTLRLAVSRGTTSDRPAPAMPRGMGNLITFIHSAENFAVADLTRGFAFGWLTEPVVSDRAYLRYHFVEPLAYVTLGSLYLTSIHAACVALDGAGVLLCGDSGAGKTSFAYSCSKRGWTYITDDAASLLRTAADRKVIGRPHHIRFRSSASELFPELAAHPAALRANGKLDIEVRTADLGLTSTAAEVTADYLVFLKRGDKGEPRLTAMDPERAYAWLEQVVCFGEENVQREQKESLRSLVHIPVFELFYSDLDSAERCLRSLVRSGVIL
jgi:hypothetical protein